MGKNTNVRLQNRVKLYVRKHLHLSSSSCSVPILSGTQYLSGSLDLRTSISSSSVMSSGGGMSAW